MIQTTVEVGGMACSMCEAHINDAVRSAFPVDKVSSSHAKGKTVILSKEPLDENALRAAIEATGYHVGTIHSAPYEKKGLFSFFKKLYGPPCPALSTKIGRNTDINQLFFFSPLFCFPPTEKYPRQPLRLPGVFLYL